VSLIARLVRAELLKVRTTRTTWALLAAMALLVLAVVCLTLATAKTHSLAGGGVRTVLSLGGSLAYIFTLTIGIIGLAGEYRHGTMGQTMLAAPARWEIVVAKTLTYLVVGAIFGVIAVALTLVLAVPWLPAKHAGFSLGATLPLEIIAGSIVACALFGAIGVGLAALLQEQVIALFVGVGWTLLIDTLVSGVAPDVGKFFPGGALSALVRDQTDHVLPVGIGGLVLLGYAALFVGAGTIVARRRDLT
jgi:ABC-2 type transport system permease protein